MLNIHLITLTIFNKNIYLQFYKNNFKKRKNKQTRGSFDCTKLGITSELTIYKIKHFVLVIYLQDSRNDFREKD